MTTSSAAVRAILHPLSQLTPDEIRESARLIREYYPKDVEFVFKTITLYEPDKALVLEYLAAEQAKSSTRPSIERRSFVAYYKRGHVRIHAQNMALMFDADIQ